MLTSTERQLIWNGSFGYLPSSNLLSKHSCFSCMKDISKRRLELAIYSALYGKDEVHKRGFHYYHSEGRTKRAMMHILESPIFWKDYAQKSKFKEPELLNNWTEDKLQRWELMNNIGLHFVIESKNLITGKLKLVDFRRPKILKPDKTVFIYILRKAHIPFYMRKYFSSDFCFIAIHDINRFQCEKLAGCSYCNETLAKMHNDWMTANGFNNVSEN